MSNQSPEWDEAALEKLGKIPSFVRSIAMKKIEAAARSAGVTVITAEFVETSKAQMMK